MKIENIEKVGDLVYIYNTNKRRLEDLQKVADGLADFNAEKLCDTTRDLCLFYKNGTAADILRAAVADMLRERIKLTAECVQRIKTEIEKL